MKAIAEMMGVARSHLVERMKAGEKPARCHYRKTDDAWLLPLIRELAWQYYCEIRVAIV